LRWSLYTKHEYEELIEEIKRHDKLYYLEATPEITDYAYDQLYKKLEAMEKAHPEWVSSSSPTQRVGDPLRSGFSQVSHTNPMLSLANTYSKEELEDFIKRVHKLLEKKDIPFCAELKMDGVAVSVRYEKGKYVRALTRGDGKKGDDVTANMKTILTLPLELDISPIPDVLEIRGEVFMTHKVFQSLNLKKEEAGEEPYANPRNATAGALKLLDPKEVGTRKLSCVFYGLAEESTASIETQFEVHAFLKACELPSFLKEHIALCHTAEDILTFAEKIEAARKMLPFDIDGVVIKVNELRYHPMLGTTGKSPRFAVAYKFAPEQAETRIKDITVQVGRTGVLTPVAELEPVLLAGSTISRATLHNQEEVERKDIRIGDHVIIEKGGDVIPKVVEVDHKKRPHGTHPWKMPKTCPACGSHIVHEEGEVAYRCINKDCIEQRLRRVAYFVSKDALDIAHLGEKVVEQLVLKGLVTNVSDIFALTETDLVQLEGFKEKSIKNLLESIEKAKEVSLSRFILALGIKHIGEGTAELLADRSGSIEHLAKMTKDELLEIEGIGEKMADSIIAYFQEPSHLKEIEKLYAEGVKPHAVKIKINKDHPFYGKSFVLTGTLSEFPRSVATALIKERGGKVIGSVSKNTDYLLAGEEAGSKLDKAKELKVAILSEKEFKDLL